MAVAAALGQVPKQLWPLSHTLLQRAAFSTAPPAPGAAAAAAAPKPPGPPPPPPGPSLAPHLMEVFVNGESVIVPKSFTVLQACDAAGVDIPR